MIEILEAVGAFLLVLGILVFVHEFGHFIVAKSFGVGVPVFSFGLGPRLFGFRRGETDYRFSLIPLGGYVRMTGDESDENRTGAPQEFLSRPRWQRFLVFIAGAVFNIVLALLVTWLAFSVYGKDEVKLSERYPVVASVREGSPAAAAGFRVGDRVLRIAGRDARLPDTEEEEILLSPDTFKAVEVERGGGTLTLRLHTGADPRYHLGAPGWQLIQDSVGPAAIEVVLGDSPAEAAGLRTGDSIVGVNGRSPIREVELREILASSPGEDVRLQVERDGTTRTVIVVPRNEQGRGMIGVLFRPAGLVHLDFTVAQAAVESFWFNLEQSQALFKALNKLFRREISMRALSGPIEIAQFSRRAVQRLRTFLHFLAFISLQLGILNLLPIPVLDGGHILILGLEGAIRRDLSDRVKERVMQLGLVFLIVVFSFVIYFDLMKLGT